MVFVFLIIWNVHANWISFFWEKLDEWNLNGSNLELIQEQIDNIQDIYGLNTDIVVLWKGDGQDCYLDYNFDSCVQENYNYNSNVIAILKMKSSISNEWDMRTLVKDTYDSIFSSYDAKIIQDSIVYNFWNWDFTKWLLEYYEKLNSDLNNECERIFEENTFFGWWKKEKDCNLANLISIQDETYTLIAEHEANQAFKRNIYLAVFIFWIIFSVILLRYYYISRLKKLFEDIKYKIIDFSKTDTFKIEKDELFKELKNIESKAQEYLWNIDKNPFKVKKQYNNLNNNYEEILKLIDDSLKNFNSQEELNNKINDLKDLDL
jgi:hypothetical protein